MQHGRYRLAGMLDVLGSTTGSMRIMLRIRREALLEQEMDYVPRGIFKRNGNTRSCREQWDGNKTGQSFCPACFSDA